MLEPDDFRAIERIMDDKLERFMELVNRGFSGMQQQMDLRFGEVKQQFVEVNQQFKEVNRQFNDVNQRFDKLYNHVDGFMKLYTRHDEDIVILISRVNDLEKEVKELKVKVGIQQ